MLNEHALAVVREEITEALLPVVIDRASEDTAIVGNGCSVQFKKSSCPLPYNNSQMSEIRKALFRLPDYQKAWAYYAYDEKMVWRNVEIVTKELWRRFLDKQSKKFRQKKLDTLKHMAFMAVQACRTKVLFDRELYPPANLQFFLKVSDSNWRRDWLPYWREMTEIVHSMDREVVTYVYWNTGKKRAHCANNESFKGRFERVHGL